MNDKVATAQGGKVSNLYQELLRSQELDKEEVLRVKASKPIFQSGR
jgi:hypothetical protein